MAGQVRSVIWRLFELAPTPAALAAADAAAVRAIVEPLGLAPKRAPMLQRFSREYLAKDVRRPRSSAHPLLQPLSAGRGSGVVASAGSGVWPRKGTGTCGAVGANAQARADAAALLARVSGQGRA